MSSPKSSRSKSEPASSLSPLLDPPANTITEKVSDSHSGWEMWVADEGLINNPQAGRPNSNSPSSPSSIPFIFDDPNGFHQDQLKFGHSTPSIPQPFDRPLPPVTSSSPPPISSTPPIGLSSTTPPVSSTTPPSSPPRPSSQLAHSSEAASLTGIGSLSNYKPVLHLPSYDRPISTPPNPNSNSIPRLHLEQFLPHSHLKSSRQSSYQSPSKPALSISLPALKSGASVAKDAQPGPPDHLSGSLDPALTAQPEPLSTKLQAAPDSMANLPESLNRSSPLPRRSSAGKPDQPGVSPRTTSISTNAIPLTSSRAPQHSRSSAVSGLIPSPRGLSTGPNSCYASAYEVFDRHVVRVQPTRATQRSGLPSSNTPGYPEIPPLPTPKKSYPQPPAEVCVECMMRDRDMAGVDVVGPGVWARKSDADFEEAMAAEAALDEEEEFSEYGEGPNRSPQCRASFGRSSSGGEDVLDESGRGSKSQARGVHPHLSSSAGRASISRESCELGNGSIGSAGNAHRSRPRRKRLGRGDPLMAPSLKAWTQMNPPAASHRWRTLQLYLKEQRHYLELEHQAKLTTQIENERAEQLIRNSVDTVGRANHLHGQANSPSRVDYNFLHTVPVRGRAGHRASTTTLLSSGMVVETLDISKDEKEAAKYRANDGKQRQGPSTRRVSSSSTTRNGFPQSPTAATLNTHLLGAENSLTQHTGLSLPPGSPSTRPPSPSRFSVGSRRSAFADSIRPFSAWVRKRRSGSHSVLSFAPSGSMVEMHVGLSQDRHQHGFGAHPGGHGSVRSMTMDSTTQIGAVGEQMPNLASLGANGGLMQVTASGAEQEPKKDKKKLKTTLKGLLMRLGLGRQRACSIDRISAPSPIGAATRGRALHADDEPLAPPPSLSVLAREQQHQRRNRSALSLPLSTSRRFVFRPQSISTATGGLDSGLSSPVSQFMGPSSGSNVHLGVVVGGPGGAGHRSPYMHAQDGRFDSLAEELEVPVQTRGRSGSGSAQTGSERSGSAQDLAADQLQPWSSGTTDKSGGSMRTVMSRSSQMLGKVPGFGGRGRCQSSASGTVPLSAKEVRAASINELGGSGVGGCGVPRRVGSGGDGQQQQQEPVRVQRPEYLPLEKSRHGVSRSSDFLALRYVSIGNEQQV